SCCGADVQLGCDLAVGHAAGDEGQDFALALGDLVEFVASAGVATRRGQLPVGGELVDQPAGDGGREQGVSCGDDADRGDDVGQCHVLDQESAGAREQRGVDVVVVVERGQNQHSHI